MYAGTWFQGLEATLISTFSFPWLLSYNGLSLTKSRWGHIERCKAFPTLGPGKTRTHCARPWKRGNNFVLRAYTRFTETIFGVHHKCYTRGKTTQQWRIQVSSFCWGLSPSCRENVAVLAEVNLFAPKSKKYFLPTLYRETYKWYYENLVVQSFFF